jgi:nucleoside-diphosphate-sugar epimerase
MCQKCRQKRPLGFSGTHGSCGTISRVTTLSTGATGFTGSEIVRQHAAAGQQTRAMLYGPSGAPLLAGVDGDVDVDVDVDPSHGDLTSIRSLALAAKGG